MAHRDADQMLKTFRSLSMPTEDMSQIPMQPAVYRGSLPVDGYTRTVIGERDLLGERLEIYAREDIRVTEIAPQFFDVPHLASDIGTSKYDFPDNVYIYRDAIYALELKDEEIVELGRAVMPMFSSGFSREGAACIFILAQNVKKPGTDYKVRLFKGIVDLNMATDTYYSDFSKEYTVFDNRVEKVISTSSPPVEAAFYCYIAASTLRLFTKSAGNFVKAWDHILKGFQKFYGDTPHVKFLAATENSIDALANIFSVDDRMKMSLYRILYAANQETSHEGFKRFMYDMHLSNTGLHIVGAFAGLVRTLNCNTRLLLTVIDSPMFENQIRALVEFIRLMASKDPNHQRKMWRYGRLFDEDFMSDLQTKKCPILVYILASALQAENLETHKDILKIAQLKDVSPENQRKAKKAAEKLLSMVRSYMNEGKGSGLTKIFN